MHIVRLEAHNVKRLRSIRIEPDPENPLVVISGENDQGKTSTLDAIAYALGGARLIPKEPIREGQNRASVRVDLGELVVERVWERGKASYVEVRQSSDGTKLGSPQAILDAIASALTFDPLAFAKADKQKQLETLRALVGLDFTEHDARRKTLFEDRTDLGRIERSLEARLKTMPTHERAPAEEVSLAELTAELERAMQAAHEKERDASAARDCRQRAGAAGERALAKGAELERLKVIHMKEFEDLQRRQAAEQLRTLADQVAAEQLAKEQAALAAELEQRVEQAPRIDLDAIRVRVSEAQITNRHVRENLAAQAVAKELAEQKQRVSDLTSKIDALDAHKRDMIARAKYPVPGLGLSDDGVTFNGFAFSQAAESQRIRISAAIGFALNPTLRVLLIRDGSGLDRKSERMLGEMAAAANCQVWLETTKEGPGYVVIEDGEVVSHG